MMRAYSTDFCCQVRESPVFASSHRPGAASASVKMQKNPISRIFVNVLIDVSSSIRRQD
jgi:hypothetical protein